MRWHWVIAQQRSTCYGESRKEGHRGHTGSGEVRPHVGPRSEGCDVPAKGQKKLSATVIAWRAQAKFEPTQKITLLVQGNPKRRTAATRYAFYKNGMTVGQYQDVMSKNNGSAKQAMVDMRWDYVSKFIDIK